MRFRNSIDQKYKVIHNIERGSCMNKVGVTFNYYPVNSLDHVDQKSNPLDFSTLVTFTVNHYH